MGQTDVTVVIATQNRRRELRHTLARLAALDERPAVVVVDNASTDGTADDVRRAHPDAGVVALSRNIGAAARNVGVERADTPLVAFSDDDSWWAPGALRVAADVFDAHPRLAVLAARILVGPEGGTDPVCADMASSPLPRAPDLPGPPVLGFVACGAVVRRDAFLAAGGFHQRFMVGGEEELLSLDLAAQGWGLAYVPDVVAVHHPSVSRNPSRRRQVQQRNALWTTWLRRPVTQAGRHTAAAMVDGLRDRDLRLGLYEAVRTGWWLWRQRRVVPATLERQIRMLQSQGKPPG